MKKILLLLTLFCATTFTACDIEDPHDDFIYDEVTYTGELVVIPLNGGDTYTWANTHVGVIEERDGSLTLWLYETRFVPQMPAMDMAIPHITYVTTPTLTSLLGDKIVPYIGQRPYEQYLVTILSGTVMGPQLNISFNCMGCRVTFIGTENYF